MSSLAELRKELKEIRKSTVHPVSRMKKADLLAELAKHRGSEVKAVVEEKKAVEKTDPKVVKTVKAVKEVKKTDPKVVKTVKKVEVAEEKHEKVAAIKVPKKEKAEPKAKKDTEMPPAAKKEAPVLSKHMKSKD